MAVRLNKVILAGNLTRHPQVRFLQDGSAVVNFGLATSRKYKSGGEIKEDTLFIDCECWGKTAENVGQYLSKGRGALVEGRLKLDNWEDKQGNKRSTIRVHCDTVQFTDSRPAAGSTPAPAAAAAPPVTDDDDQTPF